MKIPFPKNDVSILDRFEKSRETHALNERIVNEAREMLRRLTGGYES